MSYILKPIDAFLDRITMYRLVLYVLTGLLIIAAGEGAFGILPYSPVAIIFSTFLATLTCWGVNEAISSPLRAAKSTESVYITAFIIALILPPVAFGSAEPALVVIAASALAMASKYVFAFRKKHLFNPAAFGVALTGLLMGGYASWWVGGNLALLPFVLIGGLAIVRKIRRFDSVISFIVFALAAITLTTPASNLLIPSELTLIHTPLFFFAFIMLTEPMTAPPTRMLRIIYGALTGILFAPAFHIGGFYSSPELALLAGNVFAFIVSPKGRHVLTLLRIEETSATTRDFIFSVRRAFAFLPGQYLEWTLPHTSPDSRGTRRYFTIASSPTENEVRLGVKFYPHPSSFKQALMRLTPGATITASQLSGEFTLPKDKNEKMVFIAGGIGVTPFRSMFRYLLDRNEKRDIVLLYGNRTVEDTAYGPIISEAEGKLGTKVVHVIAENAAPGVRSGFITPTVITEEVPDYRERTFYISGPQVMVSAMRTTLLGLGVHMSRIRTDYFSGLA